MANEINESNDTYTKWQHEREMTRIETQSKRWFIAFMVVLAMLFITNAAWVIYENQFQDVVIEQDADSGLGGDATIYGAGIGDVNVGQSETGNPNPGEAQQ